MAWNPTNHPSGDIGMFRPLRTSHREATQRAYTLTELLVVIFLLGLIASVAIPSPTLGDMRKLDLTASEIANAMRFARSEAIRVGVARGFHQQWGAKRIRVFSLDTNTTPATLTFDVYHPIDKQIYLREFTRAPTDFSGTVSNSPAYRGACSEASKVYFDASGIPWCSDPVDVLLERFEVTLTLGSSTRVVTLEGITGRVTIQ
jgi:prepilin-type N-terminal cleavage/methylation domain-containing protein